MQVRLDDLKAVTLTVLTNSGYPADEAHIILDVLLYAQLRGNNQGIVKLIGAGMPRSANARPIQITRETKLSALLDGGWNAGMVALTRAVDIAIDKAREHGIGIVGTNQTNTSTGAIGYYASRAAQAGFIAFVFSGSGEYVAMHGSYEPLFGTNPLAIAIPTTGQPIVFDMATSAIARFGIVEAKTAGRSIPEGVAYDANGQPTTDAAAALLGAIRTFGGYKGAALSLMVEVLTGALVSTTKDANGKKTDWGNLVLVIDPELLVDGDTFEERTSQLIERVKAAKRLPGVEDILIPGERGNRILAQIEQTGMVEIDDALWSALVAVAG
ncbi:MAG: Ldh family oxidoreductase [Chloroflexi bacterium]|uniref:Ldh family oxidoreductase n=1 Tax=Candidatus Flexifilum breve TaxID=3140694 RepID=UPI003136B054|nr:Ldh family oxidoreductase [Chloroflexota bacterium]